MKMEINDVYTSYGECRCCLAKGHHRDSTKEYYFNNIREVYLESFKECFNLSLSSHKNMTTLICSTCVQRLRDAVSFRMMVVSTEKQLLLSVSNENNHTEFVNVPEDESYDNIKAEIKSEEVDIEDIFLQDGIVTQDDDYEPDFPTELNYDDEDSKDTEPLELVDGEAELLARFSGESLRKLPSRCSLLSVCPKYVYYLDKLRDKMIKPKSLEALLIRPGKDPPFKMASQNRYVTDKIAHIINASTLLEHSNATVFKSKMRSGYPCFYCRQIFNHNTLKDHQKIHPKNLLFKLLAKYTADGLVVYADITDLKCTICDQNISNLNELKLHLTERHKKKIYLEYHDRVIPFKLRETDLECQVCGRRFETFGSVERHMNSHYGNYICEECGAGFVTKNRLGIHAYSTHKQGNFPCDLCKKIFQTQLKYKIHVDAVHKQLKKMRCPKCPEKFIDYFTRQKHLVSIHGAERILYKCNVCDRGFDRKYTLNLHMKRTHLAQKDVKCKFCPYMCFNKTELKEHMVKHGAMKPSQCAICKKVFTRKRSLLSHMKIHNNDKRFCCYVCGLVFVQKCTLNAHMKTHQFE